VYDTVVQVSFYLGLMAAIIKCLGSMIPRRDLSAPLTHSKLGGARTPGRPRVLVLHLPSLRRETGRFLGRRLADTTPALGKGWAVPQTAHAAEKNVIGVTLALLARDSITRIPPPTARNIMQLKVSFKCVVCGFDIC
jgi:hypothetical protein